MARRSHLRASDADREFIAEQLRNAAAEGRLRAEELEHRLEAALTARTYGELTAVVSDLPRERTTARGPHQPHLHLRPVTVAGLLLLLPLALVAVAAAFVAVVALLTAWGLALTLAGLFLGSRARGLPGPWVVGWRVLHGPHGRRIAGSISRRG
jgi:hypothetical protein